MEKKEILHLGKLSRIRISEEEAGELLGDIDAVLSYVSVIDDITADSGVTKKVGAVYNIFREDIVTCEAGVYTEALLREAPKRKGNHLAVRKILNTNDGNA